MRQNRHPLHYVYHGMKQRCLNPNAKKYKIYGARGITICNSWLGEKGFFNFINDMGDRPPNTTLDRVENDKGYYKENCRWATPNQQQANRRNNNKIVGVHYNKNERKYKALLYTNGEIVFEKLYKTYDEAVDGRRQAEIKFLNN